MRLSETVWRELMEVGLLEGDEACALCPDRPVVLLDLARAPVLLCTKHATEVSRQLQEDLAPPALEPSGRTRSDESLRRVAQAET